MRKLLIICLLVCLGLEAEAQLKPPTITGVSVSPDDGLVSIHWISSSSSNISHYVVYRFYKGAGNDPIQVSPALNSYTFRYDTAKVKSLIFYMVTEAGLPGHLAASDTSPAHSTLHLKHTYDSCNAQILLNWTRYRAWSSIKEYRIYRKPEGGSWTEISGSLVDSTYADKQPLMPSTKYYYYVQATNANSDIVTSFRDSVITNSAKTLSVLSAVSTSCANPSLADIRFRIDPSTNLRMFEIQKSDAYSGTFTTVKTVKGLPSPEISYIDTLKSRQIQFYRIVAKDFCLHDFKISNTANLIVPICNMTNNQVNLVWNEYREWPSGVDHYNITRSVGGAAFQSIGTTAQTSFSDNVFDLAGKQLAGKFCYIIEAVSGVEPTLNSSFTSISMPVCVDLSEFIFIPQAFTPNGDGQNDVFQPAFAFQPSAYTLILYNRAGAKVFETSNPAVGWDGRVNNGGQADTGVYVYFLKFSTSSGNVIEKKGTVALIYP